MILFTNRNGASRSFRPRAEILPTRETATGGLSGVCCQEPNATMTNLVGHRRRWGRYDNGSDLTGIKCPRLLRQSYGSANPARKSPARNTSTMSPVNRSGTASLQPVHDPSSGRISCGPVDPAGAGCKMKEPTRIRPGPILIQPARRVDVGRQSGDLPATSRCVCPMSQCGQSVDGLGGDHANAARSRFPGLVQDAAD
jgi:hypothetical protein